MDFNSILFQAHSGWRWLVLLVIVITTLKVLLGWLAGQKWTGFDTNLLRLTNVVLSIQVVLGIVLYVFYLWQGRPDGVGFGFAHALPALLSLGGVGFASARSRKAEGSRRKFMLASIGMLFTVLMIYGALARVGGPFV